jgi:hypothetical protein
LEPKKSRRSNRKKQTQKKQTNNKIFSSDESSVTELRPSSTIARSKKRGLLPNWENIFRQEKATIQTKTADTEKSFIQPRLFYHQDANVPIGDEIAHQTESPDHETIWFHNINGMKDEQNWAQIIATMKENNVEIFGFAEINISMDNFSKNRWHSIIKKQYYLS